MKKVLSILLCIVMVLSVFTVVPAVTASALTSGVYEYKVLDDGTAEITGYSQNYYDRDTTIPSYLDGYLVTSIGMCAFYMCENLTSVVIPDSVKTIGEEAFYYCTELTSIDIPDSVTSIGDYAFLGCHRLTSIEIPDSVTYIGGAVFGDCWRLTSVEVAKDNPVYDSRDNCNAVIETASNKLIFGCDNTMIPDSVTSIGYGAFYGCTGLTSVTIDNSVTTIGDHAFFGCTGLTSIVIPDSVTSIGDSAFSRCTNLTSVVIGNSVTIIGNYAFENCENLTSVVIGNSVESIGKGAFKYCWFTSIVIPDSVKNIYNKAFYGCTGLTSVTIGNSVTTIGDYAFYNCRGLTSIVIPDSVTSIGDSAFSQCTNLTSVVIGDSVTITGNYAFENCNNLTSVVFGISVTRIGVNAFPVLENLTFFGYTGSAAETYANKNGFTFVMLTDKADETTGITAATPEDIAMTAEDISNSGEATTAAARLGKNADVIAVYDINLTDENGEKVQPEAAVQVKIPCDNESARVYRREDDGSLTDMNASYKDGYKVFYTDHFSLYILAVPGEESAQYILGDADGDEDVSSVDVTLIQRYCADFNLNIPEETLLHGDVDGSGDLEILDATLIQRFLADFNVHYPIGERV